MPSSSPLVANALFNYNADLQFFRGASDAAIICIYENTLASLLLFIAHCPAQWYGCVKKMLEIICTDLPLKTSLKLTFLQLLRVRNVWISS